MKRKSKIFLIILSLFVCLFVSCGIPNYFGNYSKYVKFNGSSLTIDDKSYSDGFNSRQIVPKVMFLYTIYSNGAIKQVESYKVKSELGSEFRHDFKLSDYDYKGCPYFGNRPVSKATIKDFDDVEHEVGLYQFQTLGNQLNPTDTNLPTNHSSDYLANVGNMSFNYDETYHFTYMLERIGETDDAKLIITCKDDDYNVVASYYMGNYKGEVFHTTELSSRSEDYKYTGNDPKIFILPVLYLESDVYSNRQMMIGNWTEIQLKLPDLPATDKEQPNNKQ